MPVCPYCTSRHSKFANRLTNVSRYRCVKCKKLFVISNHSPVPTKQGVPERGYFIYGHQGKEHVFEKALQDFGYWNAERSSAYIILADVDTQGRIAQLSDQLTKGKSRLFVYPHAARPFIGWDGLFTSSEHTSATFVFAEGHIDVIRAYGYKKPLHVVGWAYSELRPFVPVCNPKKILFAPIHPNRNGWLSDIDKSINSRVYKILIDMIDSHGIHLTVRCIKNLSSNGIWKDMRVEYINGATNTNQISDIDDADLVVSHQTYAWIAVALGKPTIMMGEDEAPRNGGNEADFKRVKSWDKYRDLLAYPLDILAAHDPHDMIVRACESDEQIRDWRARMIGDQTFDQNKFIEAMEAYL